MARYHLAVALSTKGDWEQASREFKTVTLKAPQNSAAFYQLGLSLKESSLMKKAMSAFETAIELDPENQRVKRELQKLGKIRNQIPS